MTIARQLRLPMSALISLHGGMAAKQLYFTLFTLVVSAIVAFSGPDLVFDTRYILGIIIVGVACVLAFTVPWSKFHSRWMITVPLLDFVAIGLFRETLTVEVPGIALLCFIPTLWLSAQHRREGVGLAVIAAVLTIAVPTVVHASPGLDSVVLARASLLPLTVLQVGLLVASALGRLDRQVETTNQALQEKGSLLEKTILQERQLENILNTINVGVLVVDRDGHEVLTNPAQQRFHVLAAPESSSETGETELLLRYPNTVYEIPPQERPVQRATSGESFSNYVVAIGPVGESKKLSISARQVTDSSGVRDGAIITFSDVSAYYEAAQTQQQFVAAVSHELRTPLTSIIGYLDLLADEDLPETAETSLEVVNRNAEQLLKLVEDLLESQSSQSKVLSLDLNSTRVSTIVEQACETFIQCAAENSITIEQDIAPAAALLVDSARLTQAVDNLLSNAVKYTPPGGTVTVTVRDLNEAVEIKVADTGIGISDADQSTLFTPYFRASTAKSHNIAGHGLGLSITQEIVLAHGGQIGVTSTAGEGSVFTIRLPKSATPHSRR